MNKDNRLILVCYAAFALSAAFFIACQWWGYGDGAQIHSIVLEGLSRTPVQIILCLVFMFMGLSLLRISMSREVHKKAIQFRNENGDITIIVSVVEQAIRKIVLELSSVTDIKNKVFLKGKGLKVVCRVSLNTREGISQIVHNIQEIIKDNIVKLVGFELDIMVHVHITHVSLSEPASVASSTLAELPESPEHVEGLS